MPICLEPLPNKVCVEDCLTERDETVFFLRVIVIIEGINVAIFIECEIVYRGKIEKVSAIAHTERLIIKLHPF